MKEVEFSKNVYYVQNQDSGSSREESQQEQADFNQEPA